MGLYLPEHNALFVHAPKTGGTFVTHVIRNVLHVPVRRVGYKHSNKDLVGPIRFEKQPFTFSFTRHPLSWYASYWQNKMRRPVKGKKWYLWQPDTMWHPNWEIDPSCGDKDFGQFIRNVSQHREYLHDMYMAYTGRGTRDEIDYIGKQERLLQDLMVVFDSIGVVYDRSELESLERVNSNTSRYEAGYTDETAEMVLDAERKLLDVYDYPDDPNDVSPSPQPLESARRGPSFGLSEPADALR